jgi:hypothetical protein
VARLENAPCLREAIRLSYALVDPWMDSYERAPSTVTLDIDDTVDVPELTTVAMAVPYTSWMPPLVTVVPVAR